jgi:hypothetical protein
MEKAEQTGLRLEPSLKRALERAAKEDARSLNSLIRKVLADWLKSHQPAKEQRR